MTIERESPMPAPGRGVATVPSGDARATPTVTPLGPDVIGWAECTGSSDRWAVWRLTFFARPFPMARLAAPDRSKED